MAQRLKRLPAMQGTWVQFLGREDPLEKEMATHSNILAWRIPRMGEHGGLQSTVPGASVRNPTRDNVTQQRSDGQGWVGSQVFPLAFPEHVPAPTPPNKNPPAFPLFWHSLEKVSFHSIPKKGNIKERSSYCTIALISNASKVILKILQARLQ